MRDPHQNIFYYYRGPSKEVDDPYKDRQIENNTTKSFINILEFCRDVGCDGVWERLERLLHIPMQKIVGFDLQKNSKHMDDSGARPDAVIIRPAEQKILIESKVRAKLRYPQLKRYLAAMGKKDFLLVISDKESDKKCKDKINDDRLLFLTWKDVHRCCTETIRDMANMKDQEPICKLIRHFTDYLEIIAITEFTGFKDEDFEFWEKRNPNYKDILKRKLEAFADFIMGRLPKDIKRVYPEKKVGNVSLESDDQRFVWVAIKKKRDDGDNLNQCNFTLEVSNNSLDINVVIRNGRTGDKKGIGIFYYKLKDDPKGYLSSVENVKADAQIVVFNRWPKRKNSLHIRIGDEYWEPYKYIKNVKNVEELCGFLEEADRNKRPYGKPALSMPGVHFKYSLKKGDSILSDPDELGKYAIETIKELKPILDYLENR